MGKRVSLYLLLGLAVVVQIVLREYTVWVPDIVLLMVVFVGAFRGVGEGMVFGLAAGFLRGCFSPQTFLLDVFLFSALGVSASVLARRLNRHSPAVQILAGVTVVSATIVAHSYFLNAISGNSVNVALMIEAGRPVLIMTGACAPFVFKHLKLFCDADIS